MAQTILDIKDSELQSVTDAVQHFRPIPEGSSMTPEENVGEYLFDYLRDQVRGYERIMAAKGVKMRELKRGRGISVNLDVQG